MRRDILSDVQAIGEETNFRTVQFDNTPKALANFSPGFEEREPWDEQIKRRSNPETVRL
jgi:hypothetical protein